MKKLRTYTLLIFAIILFPVIYAGVDDEDSDFIVYKIRTYACDLYNPVAYNEIRLFSVTGVYQQNTMELIHKIGKYEINSDTLTLNKPKVYYVVDISCDCNSDTIEEPYKKFLIRDSSLIMLPECKDTFRLQHEVMFIDYGMPKFHHYKKRNDIITSKRKELILEAVSSIPVEPEIQKPVIRMPK